LQLLRRGHLTKRAAAQCVGEAAARSHQARIMVQRRGHRAEIAVKVGAPVGPA